MTTNPATERSASPLNELALNIAHVFFGQQFDGNPETLAGIISQQLEDAGVVIPVEPADFCAQVGDCEECPQPDNCICEHHAPTGQPVAEKATPRYVILPDLPLDIYETPDPDTNALIAECPSEVHAKLGLNALNQSAAVDALVEALKAMVVMADRGPQPRKLDEALTWRQNDEKARAMAAAALAEVDRLRNAAGGD